MDFDWDVSSFVVVLLYVVLLAPFIIAVVFTFYLLLSPGPRSNTPSDMDAPAEDP